MCHNLSVCLGFEILLHAFLTSISFASVSNMFRWCRTGCSRSPCPRSPLAMALPTPPPGDRYHHTCNKNELLRQGWKSMIGIGPHPSSAHPIYFLPYFPATVSLSPPASKHRCKAAEHLCVRISCKRSTQSASNWKNRKEQIADTLLTVSSN